MRIEIPFVTPSVQSRYGDVSNRKAVNWYLQMPAQGGKSQIVAYPAPGISPLISAGPGPARSNGAIFNNLAYFICGNKLIELPSGAVRGTLDSASGRCSLVAGRTALLIVDGVDAYTWNGTIFAKVVLPPFSGPTHCEYIDTFFIVNELDTERVWISAPEDPTSWNAADFTSAEARKDNILALSSFSRDLYAFGEDTTEVLYNTGNQDVPFERYPGGLFEVGIAAPYSAARSGAGVFWICKNIDGDAMVMTANGLTHTPVSDDAVEWQINSYDTVEDAIGMVYRIGGRWFYELTFPSANRTWVYQVEDKMWHERQSYGLGRHCISGHVFFNKQHIVADCQVPRFGVMEHDVYTEWGTTIERILVTPPIDKDDRILTYNELVVEVNSGMGLTAGQGVDPQIAMRYSDDGGDSWSHELWRGMGAKGEYGQRCVWDRLGQSRRRVFEVKVTDPVGVSVLKAYADVELAPF